MQSASRHQSLELAIRTTGDASQSLFRFGAVVLAGLAAMAANTPLAAQDAAATQARDVLERHCARCHQSGKLENPPAKGRFGNIFDLDALLRAPPLVRAGEPDGSRLYQIMLSRHRPQDVFFGPVVGPSADEIQHVRDWIAAAKVPDDPECKSRVPVTAAEVTRDTKAWLKSFAPDDATEVRFVSLVHLFNACRSDADLAHYRTAVSAVLAGLSTQDAPITAEAFGDTSAVMAFRPSQLGWTLTDWDAFSSVRDPLVPVAADYLAARAQSRADIYTASRAAAAISAAGLGEVRGIDAISALASEYFSRVNFTHAAAEMGDLPADFVARLKSATGDAIALARQLQQASLTRADWETLKAALSNTPLPAGGVSEPSSSLDLALWSDKSEYAPGELLTINAKTGSDCYLTLVAVEPDGQATVLFPNDFTPDNRVAAKQIITVPPASAEYQLRLSKPGKQSVIAICNAEARRPEGIGHDLERQRFTSLGDWRTFLATSKEKEAEYQRIEEEGRKFRARNSPKPEPPQEQLPVGTENEGRAGIMFEVK
jgi:hypothetical protein